MSDFLDFAGVRIQHLTKLSDRQDYCLVKVELDPGVGMSLHTHPERETAFVLSGEFEAWTEDEGWVVLPPGGIVDVMENKKHAGRNSVSSSEKTVLLIATTTNMGRLIDEVGRPVDSVQPGPPDPEAIQHFIEVSLSYGHWFGTPEENATIGFSME